MSLLLEVTHDVKSSGGLGSGEVDWLQHSIFIDSPAYEVID